MGGKICACVFIFVILRIEFWAQSENCSRFCSVLDKTNITVRKLKFNILKKGE